MNTAERGTVSKLSGFAPHELAFLAGEHRGFSPANRNAFLPAIEYRVMNETEDQVSLFMYEIRAAILGVKPGFLPPPAPSAGPGADLTVQLASNRLF